MEAVTLLQWTFDALLGLGLLWLAWRALACPDLFRAIVLFIAFGVSLQLRPLVTYQCTWQLVSLAAGRSVFGDG